MWLDNAGQEIVNNFWRRCGETEEFPRRLERSISLAAPVCLVKLPRLKLAAVESWLARRGVSFQFNCGNRAVRGCLVAFGGDGFIFVDGSDPEDEQRFTLAHELAHFLTDYWLAREKALKKFGPAITEVFDGLRQPTVTERVHYILHKIADSNVISRLKRSIGGVDDGLWQRLPSLAPGQAIISAASLARPLLVAIDPTPCKLRMVD